MNEPISKTAESTVREKIQEGARIEMPLYRHRKGKVFHASGSWQTTKSEKRLIETFGYLFFFGVFPGLILLMIHPGTLAAVLLGIGVTGAVGTFISLFAVAFHKHRQKPMEGHYYDTDYKYNALTGEETDNTREITKDEFFGEKG